MEVQLLVLTHSGWSQQTLYPSFSHGPQHMGEGKQRGIQKEVIHISKTLPSIGRELGLLKRLLSA